MIKTRRVLLHVCCAPCCCSILESLKKEGYDLTVFFYNPNIHPVDEYEIRKLEVIRYADKMGIPVVDGDYDTAVWLELTKGLENEPERGKRCDVCFARRMDVTAAYAHKHGFKAFTSSLGISRWKDFDQVTRAGRKAASRYPGLEYWAENWRKKDGTRRMTEITKEENFYRQFYCGCMYSLQNSNAKKDSAKPPTIEELDLPKKR
ncbi:MAG: epoxyqueuosine reductase QueH [Candidatus Omnitrophota bacterium]|jgi:hypothetical protein